MEQANSRTLPVADATTKEIGRVTLAAALERDRVRVRRPLERSCIAAGY